MTGLKEQIFELLLKATLLNWIPLTKFSTK